MTFEEMRNKYSSILSCGFECGPGWANIIDECLSSILPLIQNYKKDLKEDDYIPDMKVTQIKEKWGTLSIYFSSQLDTFDPFLEEAYDKSTHTCENCGAPGRLRGKKWYYTSCNSCDKCL